MQGKGSSGRRSQGEVEANPGVRHEVNSDREQEVLEAGPVVDMHRGQEVQEPDWRLQVMETRRPWGLGWWPRQVETRRLGGPGWWLTQTEAGGLGAGLAEAKMETMRL